jgi:hypothetical protein
LGWLILSKKIFHKDSLSAEIRFASIQFRLQFVLGWQSLSLDHAGWTYMEWSFLCWLSSELSQAKIFKELGKNQKSCYFLLLKSLAVMLKNHLFRQKLTIPQKPFSVKLWSKTCFHEWRVNKEMRKIRISYRNLEI